MTVKSPSLPAEFHPIIAKAIRNSSHTTLDAAIAIALDIEQLGGHALDVANALRELKTQLQERTPTDD